MEDKKPTKAERLAIQFARELKAVLRKDLFIEMITEHVKQSYINEPYCISHEYCDSNECMMKAFRKVTGKVQSMQNQEHWKLVSKAWEMAKQTNFKTE